MTYLAAILLGIIQGFTEFLPVSSSGHLVIAQYLLPGFSFPGIILEVVLHAGTLCAVVYYFREQIVKIDKKFIGYLVVGTIPAVIVGLLFKQQVETMFETLRFVGFALLLTSIFNVLTDRMAMKNVSLNNLTALFIGLFQSLAIVPGISRSGSTIFAGAYLGMKKASVAEFSFLLSIPAILGANFLELTSLDSSIDIDVLTLFVGFAAAFGSGLVAIKLTLRLLKQRSFKYFALYTAVIGLLTIFIRA